MKRLVFGTAVGIIALLLSTACSSGPPTPGPAKTSTSAPQSTSTAQVITPAATTQATSPVGAPTLPAGAPTVPSGAPSVTATSPSPTAVSPAATAAAPTTAPIVACTDHALFVTDVTIPDKTAVNAGQAFTKTWRMRNTGTCTWGSGYELVFERGSAMTTTRTVAVPTTVPGATIDLSVLATAPATAGTYTGFWRLRGPNGTFFGDTVWVTIRVPGGAAAPTATP